MPPRILRYAVCRGGWQGRRRVLATVADGCVIFCGLVLAMWIRSESTPIRVGVLSRNCGCIPEAVVDRGVICLHLKRVEPAPSWPNIAWWLAQDGTGQISSPNAAHCLFHCPFAGFVCTLSSHRRELELSAPLWLVSLLLLTCAYLADARRRQVSDETQVAGRASAPARDERSGKRDRCD